MDYDCSLVTDGTKCKMVFSFLNRCLWFSGTPNAGLSKFNFTSGKTHRLRLINTSATGLYLFSIDGHELTVIGESPLHTLVP